MPHDVVVIGGGPAGSVAAGRLAQAGLDVVVVEREEFPRYHIGESLISGMNPVLERLGVADEVRAQGFEDKTGLTLVWGRERRQWPIHFAEAGQAAPSVHVDRAQFDETLLRHAGALGASIMQPAKVTSVDVPDDGGPVTLSVRAAGGEVRLRARTVIDASGQGRIVGRQMTPVVRNDTLKNVATWTYFTGITRLPDRQHHHILVEKCAGGRGWMWGIPLSGGRLSLGVVEPMADRASRPRDSGARIREAVVRTRLMARMISDAEEVGPVRTARDWSYASERFAGENWFLCGDAAAFIDPLLSTGVCLAIAESEATADKILSVHEGRRTRGEAASSYDTEARRLVRMMTEYVEYFYDDEREMEDLEGLAASMTAMEESTEGSQAFRSLITGRFIDDGVFTR